MYYDKSVKVKKKEIVGLRKNRSIYVGVSTFSVDLLDRRLSLSRMIVGVRAKIATYSRMRGRAIF